jgi:TP901 family phage tail tape measure protein
MAVRRMDLIVTSNATAAIRGFVNLGGAASAAEARFGTMGAVAARAFAGAAVAGGIFAVQAVKAFISFDDAMTQSLAIMGEISGPMRNKMEEAAKAVAKTTRFSANDAATAYYDLASAGLSAEQAVDALPVVAQFAQAGMMDLATAAEHLTGAQTALGLKMEDPIENMRQMTRVSDVLTKANNLALGTVEDFSEALTNKAAGALRANNKELEEGVAVLAAFAEQGITGATAGEKLAIVLRDVPRAAKKNADVFAKFGISVFDASGNLKNMADIVAEFERALGPLPDGEKAAAFQALGLTRSVGDVLRTLSGTSEKIREFEGELRNAGGTTKEVAEKQMQSLAAKLDVLKNRFQVLLINVGEPIAIWLVDTLIPWIEQVGVPAIQAMASVVNEELRPAFEGVGKALDNPAVANALAGYVAFAVGLKAAAPLVALFNGVLIALAAPFKLLLLLFRPLAAALGFLSLAWTQLQIVLLPIAAALGAPVAVVAAIVVAIIAAGVAIYVFRDEVGAALQAVGRFFVRLWDDHIYPVVETIIGFFTGPFLSFWASVWDFIKGGATDVWDSISEAISGVFGEIGETIDSFLVYWKAIWAAIADIWGVIGGPIMAVVDFLTTNVLNVIINAFRALVPFFVSVWGVIQNVFTTVITFLVSAWENFGPVIIAQVLNVWNLVTGVLGNFVDYVSNFVQLVMNIFQGDWAEAWDNVKGIFSAVWDNITLIARTALTALVIFFKELPSAVFNVLMDLLPVLGDLGLALVKALAAGVLAGASFLLNVLVDLGKNILDLIKNILPVDAIVGFFGRIWEAISGPLAAVVNVVKFYFSILLAFILAPLIIIAGFIVGFWDEIKAVFSLSLGLIITAVELAWAVLWARTTFIFTAIVAIIKWAWETVIKPIFAALVWFVSNVLVPVFVFLMGVANSVWQAIVAVISWAWNTMIKPVLAGLVFFITNVLIPGFFFLMSVANLVWQGIVAAISFAWNSIILPIWTAIKFIIDTVLIPGFNFLLAVVQAVWSGILAAISFAWNAIILPIWNAIKFFIDAHLIPTFNFLKDVIVLAWQTISNAITGAWTWIRDNVFNPVVSFLDNTLMPAFTRIKDGIVGAFQAVSDFVFGVWHGIVAFMKTIINSAIGLVNKLIGGINAVLSLIPALSGDVIPEIPLLAAGGITGKKATAGAPKMASGGVAPFITDGPRAIVGEGNPRYPEFVIPTDPMHRKNAIDLYSMLGGRLMDKGGYLGLEPQFGERVKRVIDAGGGQVNVVSGFRSSAQQAVLYQRYLAGTGNLAAPPGRSKHEQGLAVDFGGNRALYTQLAEQNLLRRTVPSEPWHFEGWEGGQAGPGHVAGIIAQGVIQAAWNAATAGLDALIDQIPWKIPREYVRHHKNKFGEWVTQQDQANAVSGDFGAGVGGSEERRAGAGVQQWAGIAAEALRLTGSPPEWLNSLLRRMQQESGGNPGAINNWDSNAAKGTPSKGLMQTIDPTFYAHAGAYGSRGPFDPLANIIASINYANSRYGSAPRGWDKAGGYKTGLWRVPSDNFPALLHKDEMVAPADAADAIRSGAGGDTYNITINVPDGTRDPLSYGRQVARGFEDALVERRIRVDARVK